MKVGFKMIHGKKVIRILPESEKKFNKKMQHKITRRLARLLRKDENDDKYTNG